MATLLNATLTADGDTDTFELTDAGATVFLGDSDGSDFGGGTITVKYAPIGDANFTSDATTYTAMDTFNLDPKGGVMQCKLTLSGATSPDLNIKVFE